jgi:hypothetical protein
MANKLKMAKVHSILTLHERGWSQGGSQWPSVRTMA